MSSLVHNFPSSFCQLNIIILPKVSFKKDFWAAIQEKEISFSSFTLKYLLLFCIFMENLSSSFVSCLKQNYWKEKFIFRINFLKSNLYKLNLKLQIDFFVVIKSICIKFCWLMVFWSNHYKCLSAGMNELRDVYIDFYKEKHSPTWSVINKTWQVLS